MSRTHSTYLIERRRRPRWPWLFAVLIVAALVAAGSVLAGRPLQVGGIEVGGKSEPAASTAPPALAGAAGAAPGGASDPLTVANGAASAGDAEDPSALTDGTDAAGGTIAQAAPPPPPTATVAPNPTAQPTAAPATANGGNPAVGGGSPGELAVVTANQTGDFAAASRPGLTTAPQALTTQGTPDAAGPAGSPVADDSPILAVEEFARRWSAGDYEGLYDLLSTDAQESIARQDFIDRYVGIADRAGLTEVKLEVTGQPNLQTEVPVKVTLQSSRVGEIVEENTVGLLKEGGVWKVRWSPSLIFRDLGTDGCVELELTDTERGAILDRNGKALAIDGVIGVIGVVPGELGNNAEEDATIRALAELVDVPEDRIRAAYAETPDPTWFIPVKDVSEKTAESLLDEISELQGVRVQYTVGRVYPYGALAAHITGYLSLVTADDIAADPALEGQEWVARAGIEAGADEILAGEPGARLTVVECESRADRSVLGERAGTPAKDIVLTIDIGFQKSVEKALKDVEGAEQGSAVVIDPRTGAVMAMVSHPSFDPNSFILGTSDKEAERLADENLKPLLNRAAQATYPAGSIFKVITMAAAMAHLGYDGTTQIDCPAQYVIPGTDVIVNDWVVEEGIGAQGTLTLHQALVQSCNTVFYQIGHDLDEKDDQLLPDVTKAFGLGEATGIPYLPEANGTVPDPQWKRDQIGDYWATGDAINLSIGQGYLLATPLQMANAYAAIANNGSLLQPFIVEFAQAPEGDERERIGERDGIRRLPLEREQLREIQSALRDQTSNAAGVGSARVFGDFDWPIAGKTGTAQRGARERDKPHSWFAAYGPYGEEATIASIVMVEAKGEGVTFAAPATRAIYEAYLKTDLADIENAE